MEGKIETRSDLDRSKDPAKVRQCAIVDRRSAIDGSAVAENVDKLRDKFGGAQDTREEEVDQSEGFDGESQRLVAQLARRSGAKNEIRKFDFFEFYLQWQGVKRRSAQGVIFKASLGRFCSTHNTYENYVRCLRTTNVKIGFACAFNIWANVCGNVCVFTISSQHLAPCRNGLS